MNFSKLTNSTLVINLLFVTIGCVIGYQVSQKNLLPNLNSNSQNAANFSSSEISQSDVDLKKMFEVWGILENTYLDTQQIDRDKQLEGAIKGLSSSFEDPYTFYLPASDQKRSKEDLAGSFYGIGIQLGYVKNTLAVITPLKDSPAQKAGIMPGDLILNLKDESKNLDIDTSTISLLEAVDHIRGAKGVPITLNIFRDGEANPFEISVTRDEINVPSVELAWLSDQDGKVAHIQLSRFGDQTKAEWNKIVTQIENEPAAKGIILDLRNNPGGYLEGAIDVGSEFIPQGVIVSQEGRFKTTPYYTNRQGLLTDTPLLVLINKGSASASEILAGALREKRQTKLIGENSFGKGTVQDALELDSGDGLHVTIGRWLLPSGESIHEKGLSVDISATDNPDTQNDEVLDLALTEI